MVLVTVIVSSRRMAGGKEKIKQLVCALAWGSIICLLLSAFSYLSLKSRGTQTMSNRCPGAIRTVHEFS